MAGIFKFDENGPLVCGTVPKRRKVALIFWNLGNRHSLIVLIFIWTSNKFGQQTCIFPILLAIYLYAFITFAPQKHKQLFLEITFYL